MSAEPPILFTAGISTPTVEWREPPETLPALSDDVHLWRLSLAGPEVSRLAEMEQTLSGDERVRANRFHRASHRDRYVVGRARVRAILSRYIGCTAADIVFEYGRWGKPRVAGGNGPEFNVSHAEDLGVLAVRQDGAVGVDVERLGRPIDHLGIAAQYFETPAARAVAEAVPEAREETFLRLWTRREATLKAAGIGLSGLTKASVLPEAGFRCNVRTLVPAPGYIAALALADVKHPPRGP